MSDNREDFQSWSRDWRVMANGGAVTLFWKLQDNDAFDDDATFDPEEAIQLAYALIRAANRAALERLNSGSD